jgi:hypothetical protein
MKLETDLFFGGYGEFGLYEKICFTPSKDGAETYAKKWWNKSNKYVAHVRFDPSGLLIKHLENGYDHEENVAPGDSESDEYDADIIIFDDEDMNGNPIETYRFMTQRGLNSIVLVAINDLNEEL